MRRCWRRGRLRWGSEEGLFRSGISSRIVNAPSIDRSERLGPERRSGTFRTIANFRNGKLSVRYMDRPKLPRPVGIKAQGIRQPV